jgi:hypothetical protein
MRTSLETRLEEIEKQACGENNLLVIWPDESIETAAEKLGIDLRNPHIKLFVVYDNLTLPDNSYDQIESR